MRLAIALFLLTGVLGCRPADVVAEVDGRRITRDDLHEMMRMSGQTSIDAGLERLIADERLAAAAVRRDLHKDPLVRARIKAAERSILAQSYLDLAAPLPDEKTLLSRYDASTSLEVRQVELAHIFIATPPSASREAVLLAESRATSAWARTLGGETFESIAKDVSEDSVTKEKGGALGVIKEGAVDPVVFEAGAALKAGQVSKPIRTAFGFHIVKAIGAVESVKPTFTEARPALERELRDERLQSARTELEASIPVKRFSDAVAGEK